MKILYDHQIFYAQKYGGISRYCYELIRRIAKKEKVYFFEGFNNSSYKFENLSDFEVACSKKSCTIKQINKLAKHLNKYYFHKFVNKYPVDIYHPTYYDDFYINNGKLVVTVHDMIHELFPQQFKNDNTTLNKKRLVSKASGIITVSESTKNDLIRLFDVNPEIIKVVYLANSLSVDVYDKRIVNEPYILLVGHGSGYKNFDGFLESFNKSDFRNDLKIVCFGGNTDFDRKSWDLINKLKLTDKIILKHGDDNLLANLYKYADLFVYPSKYEGFGLPSLEAMHYGTPVLVSNTSSIPEVVGDAGMYFDPNDLDSMTTQLNYALNSKILLSEYGRKGLQRERLFSWDKCAQETLNFYYKILKESES